jgi:hypothetical protein
MLVCSDPRFHHVDGSLRWIRRGEPDPAADERWHVAVQAHQLAHAQDADPVPPRQLRKSA